jgi:alginate O-acetyltransferase complex protein AlgI
VGWVLFRAADVRSAGAMFGGMAGLHGLGISQQVAWHLTADRVIFMGAAILLVISMPRMRRNPDGLLSWLLVPLFLWGVAALAMQSFRPFLYFQF